MDESRDDGHERPKTWKKEAGENIGFRVRTVDEALADEFTARAYAVHLAHPVRFEDLSAVLREVVLRGLTDLERELSGHAEPSLKDSAQERLAQRVLNSQDTLAQRVEEASAAFEDHRQGQRALSGLLSFVDSD